MSKRKYKELTLEVIDVHEKDVIATSTDVFDGEWVTINSTDNEKLYSL